MTRIYLAAASDAAREVPAQARTKRKFSKNRYLVLATFLALVTITGALFLPTGEATIPLNVEYTVGEKMIYGTTTSTTMEMQNSTDISDLWGQLIEQAGNNTVTMDGQDTLEVVAFDGQYYTLNHTVTMNTALSSLPLSYSMLEKINKTGYSTYMFNFDVNSNLSADATYPNFLAQLLSQPDVKVGSSITVPFPAINSSFAITGNVTITFGGVEDLTVPAGTYRVFLINMTSNNIEMDLGAAAAGLLTNMNMDLNYQVYMEYGTMRQIKSTMQETMSYDTTMFSATINLAMDMTLNEHIKP